MYSLYSLYAETSYLGPDLAAFYFENFKSYEIFEEVIKRKNDAALARGESVHFGEPGKKARKL